MAWHAGWNCHIPASLTAYKTWAKEEFFLTDHTTTSQIYKTWAKEKLLLTRPRLPEFSYLTSSQEPKLQFPVQNATLNQAHHSCFGPHSLKTPTSNTPCKLSMSSCRLVNCQCALPFKLLPCFDIYKTQLTLAQMPPTVTLLPEYAARSCVHDQETLFLSRWMPR
jgi:hypothetical protein